MFLVCCYFSKIISYPWYNVFPINKSCRMFPSSLCSSHPCIADSMFLLNPIIIKVQASFPLKNFILVSSFVFLVSGFCYIQKVQTDQINLPWGTVTILTFLCDILQNPFFFVCCTHLWTSSKFGLVISKRRFPATHMSKPHKIWVMFFFLTQSLY